MIETKRHRLCLCGWAKDNAPDIYNNPVKLQNFLFLYECFAKASGEQADFSKLVFTKNEDIQIGGCYENNGAAQSN